MVFAPMQTGADGLRQGWGRRVTDRFSPQPHAPFPLILVWGRPQRRAGVRAGERACGRAGGGGLTATPESPQGGQVSRGRGGALAEWRAAESRRPGQAAGRLAGRRGWKPRAAHLSAPLSTSPSTAAPTYADISFIASCVSLQRVPFALGSRYCPLFLPLSTSLRSLVARLLAHFPARYGRGIQPSSENTTKPALFMTIQRGRRQYGAASQAASRPVRPRPRSRGPSLGHAPSLGLQAPAHLKCELLRQTHLSEPRVLPFCGTVNPDK